MARESFPLDNAEETDFDSLRGLYLPGEDVESVLEIPGESDQAGLYGKQVTVEAGQANVPVVSVPRERRERSWAIQLQIVQTLVVGGVGTYASTAGIILATITYGVGEAVFTKKVIIPTSIPIKLNIWARFVSISLTNSGGSAGTSNEVACAACPGVFLGPDFYGWSWSNTPINGADHGSVWGGAAILGQIHCILTAVPAANVVPVWPLLFDSPSGNQPANGTKPIAGGRLGAMFGVGDDRSYTDEQAPGTVGWNTGLNVALSTEPYQMAQPAPGYTMVCDVKAGS